MNEFTEEQRKRLARLDLGLQARKFLGTDMGDHLEKRCISDREEALLALAEVDPEDAKEVRRLQNDALVPLLVLQYITDIVMDGDLAETELVSQPE